MATDVIRTATDEATDALAALRDAEQELARWRQHIENAQGDPTAAGFAYQAVNSGEIVQARVADALRSSRALRQDRSVS